jgi:hypothetical protein
LEVLNGLAMGQRRGRLDAAYLELAQRLALPLATRDRALRGAATSLGVALLGEPTDFAPL